MNQRCYVSHSPVSCSATEGRRDREREREWECVMYPMLLDVCAWHSKPHCWKGEVLISIGPEMALTFSLTTLTSAEGQQPGFFPRPRAFSRGHEGHRKSNLVLSATAAHGNKTLTELLLSLVVSCHLPGKFSPPPPPSLFVLLLLFTLSHSHHPASPLKWDTSPRQQKGWWHQPLKGVRDRGKEREEVGRIRGTVVRSEPWEVQQRCPCSRKYLIVDFFLSVCKSVFWESFFGLSSVFVQCEEGEGGGSLHGTSFPSNWNQVVQPYQFILQEEMPDYVGIMQDLGFLRINTEAFASQTASWCGSDAADIVVFLCTNIHQLIPRQPHPLLHTLWAMQQLPSSSLAFYVTVTGLDCWKWTWNTCRL